MASITAEGIKTLREKTGVSLSACKRALEEASGNEMKAIEILRKKGEAKAVERGQRATGEGIIASYVHSNSKIGVLVQLGCETDFVARTKDFQELARAIAKLAASNFHASAESLLKEKLPGSSESVESALKEKIGKLGENMLLKRVVQFGSEGSLVGNYIHSPYDGALDCGRLGVLIEVKTDLGVSVAGPLLKELSMQIAATSPRWIKKEDVPPEWVEKERAIYLEQCKGMGKPEVAWPKIIEGKFKDFYKQFCLLEQNHVRDSGGKTSVLSFLDSSSKQLGSTLSISNMARFKAGEELT